jgi:hypothetical protein
LLSLGWIGWPLNLIPESSTNSIGGFVGAREKLNSVHVVGLVVVAGFLGLMTGSVAVFVIAGAVMIGASVCTGEIRGGGDARSGNRRRGR